MKFFASDKTFSEQIIVPFLATFLQRLTALVALFISTTTFSQIIFEETFDEPTGSTSGSASGVAWNSSCPTCVAGDHWNVQTGTFEAQDSNGPASWETTGSIDISSCNFIEISFDITSIGSMEACGTGCNAADWVQFQYQIDGGGFVDPGNSYMCAGPCAGINVVASDNVGTMNYTTGCIPVTGSNLQLFIAVQCWSGNEFWQIDNIRVTCSSAANSGTNGNVDVCPTSSALNLFDQLGGNPETGGTWTGPSTLTGGDLGTFDPSTMTGGVYSYTVGNAPCPTSTSTVTVNMLLAANAGTNGNTTVCLPGTPINLFSELGGTPDAGGTWNGPSTLTGGDLGTFDPATMAAGTYTYSVGTAPCNASSTVTVTTVPTANAGTNGNISICSSDANVNLFAQLGGTPDAGGTWNGPSTLAGGDLGTFNPGTMTAGTYTYSVGTAPCNASSTVTVVLTPADNASFTLADFCIGSPAPTPIITGTAGGVFSFAPIPSDGATINTTTGIIANAVAGSVYTVQYATNGTCPQTSTQTVNVHGSFTLSTTDLTICEGDNASITASGATTYSWDNGLGAGQTHSVSPVTTTTYNVTGIDANGCSQTAPLVVNVNPAPIVNAGPDQSVCENVSVTLNGSGAVTYSWDNGVTDGVSFNQPVGIVNYTLTGTGANGCLGTDQVQVTVNPFPTISAGNDTTLCEGQQFTPNASGGVIYTWDSGIANGVSFLPPNGSSTYTVTGSGANGCVNSDDIIVSVALTPEPSFVANNLSGCAPLNVTFYDETAGDFTNCIWEINGEQISACDSIQYIFTNSGSHDVTLTLTTPAGCSGTSTYTDYVFVEEPPIASFAPSTMNVTALNSTVVFNNLSSNADSYSWSFGDGIISFQENPSYSYDVNGTTNYLVQLIATNAAGCEDSTSKIINGQQDLIYYIPNSFTPDSDEFNQNFVPVFTDGFDPFDFNMKIFNRWGEVIFETYDSSIGWDGTYNGVLAEDGIYIWVVEFKTMATDERIKETGNVTLIR